MPAPVVVTLYWPEHGVVQNPLSGWSWREDGGSVSVLVDSKQHPHLPACCTPPEHQPVGVLLPEDEAVTRVSRRRTAASLGPRESSVWVSLLATDSGLPRLRALWLSGVHEHDTVLVTVLYQVLPRGRCAIGATSPESKLQRVLQILDAMAPHVCVDPCKSTALHSLARLTQSQAHVRACWPRSAVCSELAVRADVVRKGPGSHLHALALLLCADWLCGAALSHELLNHQQMVTQLVNHGVAALMQRAPAGTAHWFWGAKPLGIKLHAHVCQALSTALLQFAHANAVAGTHAARCMAPALRLLAAAGCLPFLGGLSMQCALLADMLLLLGLPLMALRAVAFAWLHLHWAGIKNLHHKLYRPPASSTPPPFRMERLTVGSLLLAPLLLLAPTLCAYGAVVALLAALPNVGGSCVRVAPQSAAFVLAALLSRLQTRSCAASAWMEPHTHANVMRLRRGCE